MKTRSGLAALTLVILCICFISTLFATTGLLEEIPSILIVVSIVGFGVFAVKITKQDTIDVDTKATGTKGKVRRGVGRDLGDSDAG